MTVTISGTNGVDLIKDDTVVTADIVNANVTPAKLSTGAPSWDSSGVFSFNSGYGSAATAYGCRAWVNFNGTGTVAIRASGNVSSITDNGVGDYTVNFTTAMPDATYSVSSANYENVGSWAGSAFGVRSGTAPTTTAVRGSCISYAGSYVDPPYVFVAIFR